jgi:replicative DNA helicase
MTNLRIEETILSNLLIDEEYSRKATPFLEADYFSEKAEKTLLMEINGFFMKYNKLPTKEIIRVQLAQRTDLTDTDLKNAIEIVDNFTDEKPTSKEWLLEQTEKFCKEKSVYNAILRSIKIIDGKDKELNKEGIPKILQDALAISFDTAVGHSYLEDATARYEFYTRKEEKIAFDLEILNDITKGGLAKKTLTLLAAQSGGGKSLVMSHFAAAALRQGKNVLYITLEMSEERIAERIDANLLGIDIDKLAELSKEEFVQKIATISKKTQGKLIVKEYPTGSAHSGHFRGLLEELKVKKDFKPDFLIVDYLGICASSRMKMGGSVNSYSYIKSIAEELRSLAVEYDIPLISATQVNRNGFDNSDIELTDTSESMGLVHTADLMLALIRTEELDEINQILIKQLKNRYADTAINKRFVVGINRSRMKLFDLEKSAQTSIATGSSFSPKGKMKKVEEPDIPLYDRSKPRPTDFGGFKF